MQRFAVRSFFQGLLNNVTNDIPRPTGECPLVPCAPYEERIANFLKKEGHWNNVAFHINGSAISVNITGRAAIEWAQRLAVGDGQRMFRQQGNMAVGQFDSQTLAIVFRKALRLRQVLFDPAAAALLPQQKHHMAA